MIKLIGSPRFYVLVGEEQNWKISFATNTWGFTEKSKGLWNTIKVGELLAFYITSPIKRIIGFGQITKKFIGEELVWPMEKFAKRALWKYRINFKSIHVIDDWNEGILNTRKIILRSSRTVVSKDLYYDFVKSADKNWKTNIHKEIKKT